MTAACLHCHRDMFGSTQTCTHLLADKLFVLGRCIDIISARAATSRRSFQLCSCGAGDPSCSGYGRALPTSALAASAVESLCLPVPACTLQLLGTSWSASPVLPRGDRCATWQCCRLALYNEHESVSGAFMVTESFFRRQRVE